MNWSICMAYNGRFASLMPSSRGYERQTHLEVTTGETEQLDLRNHGVM